MGDFSDLLAWPQVGFLAVAAVLLGAAVLGFLFGNRRESNASPRAYREKRRLGRRASHLVLEFEHGVGYLATRGKLMNVSTKGACFYSSFALKQGEWILWASAFT